MTALTTLLADHVVAAAAAVVADEAVQDPVAQERAGRRRTRHDRRAKGDRPRTGTEGWEAPRRPR